MYAPATKKSPREALCRLYGWSCDSQKRIEDYFPKESFIPININDPDAANYLKEIIKNNLWFKNREAIAYARELVLNRYQLFPYMTQQIHNYEGQPHFKTPPREMIVIPDENKFYLSPPSG